MTTATNRPTSSVTIGDLIFMGGLDCRVRSVASRLRPPWWRLASRCHADEKGRDIGVHRGTAGGAGTKVPRRVVALIKFGSAASHLARLYTASLITCRLTTSDIHRVERGDSTIRVKDSWVQIPRRSQLESRSPGGAPHYRPHDDRCLVDRAGAARAIDNPSPVYDRASLGAGDSGARPLTSTPCRSGRGRDSGCSPYGSWPGCSPAASSSKGTMRDETPRNGMSRHTACAETSCSIWCGEQFRVVAQAQV